MNAQSSAREAHWNARKRVLRYLQKSKSHMLFYKKTENLVLEGYNEFVTRIEELE